MRLSIKQFAENMCLLYLLEAPATPVLLAGAMAIIAAYTVRFDRKILCFNLNHPLSYRLKNFELLCPVERSVVATRLKNGRLQNASYMYC